LIRDVDNIPKLRQPFFGNLKYYVIMHRVLKLHYSHFTFHYTNTSSSGIMVRSVILNVVEADHRLKR